MAQNGTPPKETAKSAAPAKTVPTISENSKNSRLVSYQIEEKNGGFQLYRTILNEKNEFVKREPVSDPDAWDQVMSILEVELSVQFI